MSWIGNLLGDSAGGLVEGVAGAIDRFVETSEEEKAANLLVEKMRQEPHKWQAEINKVEAGHRSIFVAGWRPFIGWICGLGLCWTFLLEPITGTIVAITGAKVILPIIKTGELIPLVFALLGLGGMRTWEKKKGLTG